MPDLRVETFTHDLVVSSFWFIGCWFWPFEMILVLYERSASYFYWYALKFGLLLYPSCLARYVAGQLASLGMHVDVEIGEKVLFWGEVYVVGEF